jgi:hypothetical protein
VTKGLQAPSGKPEGALSRLNERGQSPSVPILASSATGASEMRRIRLNHQAHEMSLYFPKTPPQAPRRFLLLGASEVEFPNLRRAYEV